MLAFPSLSGSLTWLRLRVLLCPFVTDLAARAVEADYALSLLTLHPYRRAQPGF